MIHPEARASWADLAARLEPYVARRLPKSDVEDVLQEILLRMYRGLPDLHDDARFGPWIYMIAKNAIADHGRAKAKDQRLTRAALEDEAREEDEQRAIEERLGAYLARVVTELPSPYREAITLTELEGLTQKAAAEMAGVSLSGMKSRVQRGRAMLLQKLRDCCAIELDARGRVMSCEPRKSPADCACD